MEPIFSSESSSSSSSSSSLPERRRRITPITKASNTPTEIAPTIIIELSEDDATSLELEGPAWTSSEVNEKFKDISDVF